MKPRSPFRCFDCGKSQFNRPGENADDCQGHRDWAGIITVVVVFVGIVGSVAIKIWSEHGNY